MHEYFDDLAKICDKFLYFLSGGLITFGGILDVLDRHQWIIGFLLGLMTLAMNCHFKQKHLELVMRQKK
ncbi:MAG: hypothetical protein ACXWAT_00640 [Methylobacter sp.]